MEIQFDYQAPSTLFRLNINSALVISNVMWVCTDAVTHLVSDFCAVQRWMEANCVFVKMFVVNRLKHVKLVWSFFKIIIFEARSQVLNRSTPHGRCKSVIRRLWSVCYRWSCFTALQWALDEKPSQWKEKWQPWHGRPLFSEQQIASHMVSCLIPGMARHFFYYVTKLRYGSHNTTCPSGIGVYSPKISSATSQTCG